MFSENQPYLLSSFIVLTIILFTFLMNGILKVRHGEQETFTSVWKHLRLSVTKARVMKDKWLVAIGIPLITIIITALLRNQPDFSRAMTFTAFACALMLTAFLWHANRIIIAFFRYKLPAYHQTIYRIVYEFLFIGLVTIITVISFTTLFYIYIYDRHPDSFELMKEIAIGKLISYFMLLVYESIYFFEQWKNNIVEAESLKGIQLQSRLDTIKTQVNLQSQFESLKNQVNPHFLFNSLNSLSSLVEEDAEKAKQFIQEMSQVYRYLLQPNSKPLTTVAAELDFIRAYTFLLKTRFNEGLEIEVSIPSSYHTWLLPPLTFQMLVENAVKHNIVSSSRPLHIKLYTLDDQLIVSNNLQRRSGNAMSGKSGLENISAKYKLLNQPDIVIHETPELFEVKIPLIHEDNSIFSLNENHRLTTIKH